jgi:hypothetical protein
LGLVRRLTLILKIFLFGYKIYLFKFKGIENGLHSKYVNVKLLENELTISTSELFKNSLEEQKIMEFSVVLNFNCENGKRRELEFIQKVKKVDTCDGQKTGAVFEKPLYHGTFYGDSVIDIEKIVLKRIANDQKVNLKLEGGIFIKKNSYLDDSRFNFLRLRGLFLRFYES